MAPMTRMRFFECVFWALIINVVIAWMMMAATGSARVFSGLFEVVIIVELCVLAILGFASVRRVTDAKGGYLVPFGFMVSAVMLLSGRICDHLGQSCRGLEDGTFSSTALGYSFAGFSFCFVLLLIEPSVHEDEQDDDPRSLF